jgi:negative regulator of sigma E activity
MTSGNDTQHGDWDKRREQLSAYLDGELAERERKPLEAHLVNCTDCQRELAELRQVRQLLHALPTPALPRSFALPVPAEEPAPVRRAAHSPAPSATPSAGRGGRLARAAQWTGGLAASIGLLLILGGALVGGAHLGGAASSASQGAPVASSSQSSTNGATNAPAAGTQDHSTQTPRSLQPGAPSATTPASSPATNGGSTAGPTGATPGGTGTPQGHSQSGAETSPTVSSSTVLSLTGAGLTGGGVVLFVGGSIGRRRRRKEPGASGSW